MTPIAEDSTIVLSDYDRELDEYAKNKGKWMPSYNHALVQSRLVGAFLPFADFAILSELTLELPDARRLTPDISVFPHRASDWRHDEIRVTAMPRMAVEIISPTQGLQEILDKLDLYFEYGVKSVWVVQPGMQAIVIYEPGEGSRPQVVTTGEARDPATGLTARLEEIFA